MSKTIQDQVNEEVFMGIIPTLKSDRMYNFPDITLTAAGFGIASWCYVQGAWIANTVPFNLAMIIANIPMIFFGLILMALVIIPTRYGIDLWMYQRAVFGYKFVFVLCMIAILTTWGWYAVNCGVFGGSFVTLAGFAGYSVPGLKPLFAVLCAVIGFLLAMNGPYVVKISTYIMVPCMIFVGAVLLFKCVTSTTLHDLMQVKPLYGDTYPSYKIAFLVMTEAMFAFVFSWYPVLGGLSRITKTERSSYWGQFIGFAIAMCFFVSIGVVSATLMAGRGVYSTDPTDWLAAMGGSKVWGVLSVLVIAIANITTQTAGCYCLSLATKVFKPNWNYKIICLCYSLFCIGLILWQGIWQYYNLFLAAVAIIAAPACAIIFTDFFFIRKDKFSLKAAFQRGGHNEYQYSGGVNLVALVSFVLGMILYLSIYNPITYSVRNSALMLMTPTGVSFVTAGLSYFIFCKIPALKSYVLREKTEL